MARLCRQTTVGARSTAWCCDGSTGPRRIHRQELARLEGGRCLFFVDLTHSPSHSRLTDRPMRRCEMIDAQTGHTRGIRISALREQVHTRRDEDGETTEPRRRRLELEGRNKKPPLQRDRRHTTRHPTRLFAELRWLVRWADSGHLEEPTAQPFGAATAGSRHRARRHLRGSRCP